MANIKKTDNPDMIGEIVEKATGEELAKGAGRAAARQELFRR